MKTILVPTDFSSSADNACKFAIEIAIESNARIILMHTYESPMLYSEMPLVEFQMNADSLRETALLNLKKYAKKISRYSKGAKIELMLQQGLASARIRETALEKKADMVVLGTTGTGAVERVFMGSNALRVIRNAPCMVMAVPPKAKYAGMKKIVYTTDMTVDNLVHARTIIPVAKLFNAEILFLNVNTDLLKDSGRKNLEKITEKIKKQIRYPKISGYVCDSPNVPDGIHFFLKEHKADCLAMYTHHHSILNMLFVRSVTRTIAVHPEIPLLVIHESDFAEEHVDPKSNKQKKKRNEEEVVM